MVIRSIYFTRPELTCLPLHFFYPIADKRFCLLQSIDPTRATIVVTNIHSEVISAFKKCQKYSSRQSRFRVFMLQENIFFKKQIAMDSLWLKSKLLLQIMCTFTPLGNKTCLVSKLEKDIWLALFSM